MTEYFPDRVSEIRELETYGNIIWDRVSALPTGFCHDDLHNHNMIATENEIYLFDFDVVSIEHPMFDVASICDQTDFWTVRTEAVSETLRYLEMFYNVYGRHRNLSDAELTSVFDCIAVRHYRLLGGTDRLPLKGSSYMTEQWFDRLMLWLRDYQELTSEVI